MQLAGRRRLYDRLASRKRMGLDRGCHDVSVAQIDVKVLARRILVEDALFLEAHTGTPCVYLPILFQEAPGNARPDRR